MIRRLLLLCVLGSLSTTAAAQVWQEEFTAGGNDGAWEVWFNAYNQLPTSGGNPGGFLELDNTTGSLTCHFVEIYPTAWPAGFSGDWRGAGIDHVGLDVNLVTGPVSGGGEWTVRIANDNGTPANTADDCYVEFVSTQLPPQTPGWQSFDFPVPASSTTLPAGWSASGSCGGSASAIWNSVITNVSYFRIKLDTDPAAFCNFWAWDFGVDNLRVAGSAPTSFCSGDGSGTACPCGNPSAAGAGCANSSGTGAVLQSGGTLSAAADNLTFTATQLLPGQPALLFAGLNAVNGGSGNVFGDGLRCAGGGLVRLGVRVPGAGGDATWGPGLGAAGSWAAGDTRSFQCWYRDPVGSPCASGFNLSQGLGATFTP
jgi:hypothetical protein